ncbi:hypothetical protein [Streptomyces sp. NPDC002386]
MTTRPAAPAARSAPPTWVAERGAEGVEKVREPAGGGRPTGPVTAGHRPADGQAYGVTPTGGPAPARA